MTDVMFDLETWGLAPGSDLRSIGAVVFDPLTGNTGNWRDGWPGVHSEFYVATDNPIVADNAGDDEPVRKYPELTRDPETAKWWSDQSPEAQAAFANPVDLGAALEQFRDWFEPLQYQASETGGYLRLWCKGPQFDVTILAAAYRAVGLPVPWHYRAPRDMRTVADVAGMTQDDMRAFYTGTAHHALDDSISQARMVCEAYKRLGLQK